MWWAAYRHASVIICSNAHYLPAHKQHWQEIEIFANVGECHASERAFHDPPSRRTARFLI